MDNQITQTAADKKNPLVTFALFAYNQEKYIHEAIAGAFAQTYSPLEIILSDDSSSDRTFEIMREMAKAYCGPHAVKLNRNIENLGLIGHINKIFEMASGDLIVAAAGDDISLPSRTSRLVDAYGETGGNAMLLHSSVSKIDENGKNLGIGQPPVIIEKMSLEKIALSSALYIGATGAWHKHLYYDFGPLEFKRAYEDLTLGFRAALSNSIVYIDKPLVKYRVNIGISNRRLGFFTQRLRNNLMFVDVLRQRVSDISRLDKNRYGHIIRLLEEELSIQRARSSIFKCPKDIFRTCSTSNPITTLNAIVREVKFLAFFFKSRITFNIRSTFQKRKRLP
jgi:glycosyltransferase involved in cell wall biosynthesis